MCKTIKLLFITVFLGTTLAHAQTENSPYSRYGLGDQLSSNNLLNRAIGGVSAAYSDFFNVNFVNPASYSRLKRTSFNFGIEVDSRTLRVLDPPSKFSSASPIISYIQLGVPLSQKRNWGLNFGLRPVTRINYKVEKNESQDHLEGVQNVNTVYEGNGGSYEVFTGTGFTLGKNLGLGFNVGYLFGSKDYKSSRTILGDSSFTTFYPSEYSTNTNFGGVFANAGIQYNIKLSSIKALHLGAYGSLKRDIHATRNDKVQTYTSNETGIDSIDVIEMMTTNGKITYPATYGVGFMYYGSEKWFFGADVSQTKWSDYRYFGDKDAVQDSWIAHVGGAVVPNPTDAKSYWGRVSYRAGFSYGRDYIKLTEDLPIWNVSLGFGFPLKPPTFYSNQISVINTTIEFGRRGKSDGLIKENFFRVGIGLTLADTWFIKRKYD